MPTVNSTPGVYEERRGWNRSVIVTVSLEALLGTVALVGGVASHQVRLLLTGLLFLLGGALNAANATARRLALRVDEPGITLAKPTWRTHPGELVAWPDVRAVVIRRRARGIQVGVVRLYAGIPVSSFTTAGSPTPDVAITVATSGIDVTRFVEAIRVHAPDILIRDDRPTTNPDHPKLTKRARIAVGAGVAALLALLLTLGFLQSSDSGGYSVQAGPVGTSMTLTLPQQIGSRMLLVSGPSAFFKYQPALLPSGPASTYGTISASYASADRSKPDIDVDGIYATGTVGHRAVFSLAPQALANHVASTLFINGAQQYPSGHGGALLECGTYGDQPLCVWDDQSVLLFIGYTDVPGSTDELAALAPSFASAVGAG